MNGSTSSHSASESTLIRDMLSRIAGHPTRHWETRPSQRLAEARDNASVVILPGVGHWTALEAATEVTEQLVAHL